MTPSECKEIVLQALENFKRDIAQASGPHSGDEHNILQTYDFLGPKGQAGSVVCFAFMTPIQPKAQARRSELSRYLEAEQPAPSNPILNMLTAQSYLRLIPFDYSIIYGILAHLEASLKLNESQIKTDHPSFEKVFVPTRDVLEKLGLVLQMRRELLLAPLGFSLVKVKSYFYLFVWSIKALLDSLAVFLKTSFGLPEEGGKIDLGKGEIGKAGFMASLAIRSPALADRLIKDFRAWINEAQRYRDNTIHRRGVLISAVEGRPYRVPKDSTVDPLLASWMEPADMDKHYTTIGEFTQSWTDKALAVNSKHVVH